MNRLVLALHSYRLHSTDEGEQLQRGLEAAGWTLAGHGFGPFEDWCTDVPTLLDRHQPDVVFVQDVRDWSRESPGCYDRDAHFYGVEALRQHPRVFCVLKDAGSIPRVQWEHFEAVQPYGFVTYYADDTVRANAGLGPSVRLIRTHHSLDRDALPPLDLPRRRGLVSGARGALYPLRERVFRAADELGLDAKPHPGYGADGCDTPAYLRHLAGYRVHVATASRLGFALRKIIESVACGCVPVTDLPASDVLPEIDAALVRVRPDIGMDEMRRVIDAAEVEWATRDVGSWAKRAAEHYDYRAVGARLDAAIMAACEARRAA